jgi:hypothetical protein
VQFVAHFEERNDTLLFSEGQIDFVPRNLSSFFFKLKVLRFYFIVFLGIQTTLFNHHATSDNKFVEHALEEWVIMHNIQDLRKEYLIPQGFTTLEAVFVGIVDYEYVQECG